jgi:hypothetical protein
MTIGRRRLHAIERDPFPDIEVCDGLKTTSAIQLTMGVDMRGASVMALLVIMAGAPAGRAEPVDVGSRSGKAGTESFFHRWAVGVPYSSSEAIEISINVHADHYPDGSVIYGIDWTREDCDEDSCRVTEDPAAHVEAIQWDFHPDTGRIDADVVGLWRDGSTCRMTFGFAVGDVEFGDSKPAAYVRPDLIGPDIGITVGAGSRNRVLRAASEPDTLSMCETLHPGDLPWEAGAAYQDTGDHVEIYGEINLP